MEHYSRPIKPKDFNLKMKPFKSKVKSVIDKDNPNKTIDFKNKWGNVDYKRPLILAQYKKCAYCEVRFTTYPDVEHFFPKAKIKLLLNAGREISDLLNIKDREGKTISCNGFWWLAYEWTNYLLACGPCNETWKHNYFPLVENKASKKLLDDTSYVIKGKKYIPNLINPFDNIDGYKYFNYTKEGYIFSYNQITFNSIVTYGLHRISLFEARNEVCPNIFYNVQKYKKYLVQNNILKMKKYIKSITKLGHKSKSHSSIVKTLIFNEFGIEWEDFMEVNKDICYPINIKLDAKWEAKLYKNYEEQELKEKQINILKRLSSISRRKIGVDIVHAVFFKITGEDLTQL